MPENVLLQPVELTDAELDLVTGGALATGGLVNIALSDVNVEILTNHGLTVDVSDTLKNIANNNNISVGAVIQLLGGGAAILQHQV